MTGKIMKGVGGLYEVFVEGAGLYTCSAKGILRFNHIRPLIGDIVEIEEVAGKPMSGNLTSVLTRNNALVRPAVANVDQAMVVFAVMDPEPHLNLLDRFLIQMKVQRLPVIICFNKTDKCGDEELENFRRIYKNCGCPMLFTEAAKGKGLDEVKKLLLGKTTVLAGPSGVGKSTIMNYMLGEDRMETGGLSEKIMRGKNTTRHSELVHAGQDTFLCDTPGFSSLFLPEMRPEELGQYYEEMTIPANSCRFLGCSHRKEPDCMVKTWVTEGKIPKERYENYLLLYEEISKKKHY